MRWTKNLLILSLLEGYLDRDEEREAYFTELQENQNADYQTVCPEEEEDLRGTYKEADEERKAQELENNGSQ
jgi:hypothetical protein